MLERKENATEQNDEEKDQKQCHAESGPAGFVVPVRLVVGGTGFQQVLCLAKQVARGA